jgi:hypothetical protein
MRCTSAQSVLTLLSLPVTAGSIRDNGSREPDVGVGLLDLMSAVLDREAVLKCHLLASEARSSPMHMRTRTPIGSILVTFGFAYLAHALQHVRLRDRDRDFTRILTYLVM